MHCCFSSRYLAKMKVKMLIAAPTGCAAFNVNGSTLHSLLQLPVPMDYSNPAPALQGDQLKRLQFELKNAKILVCGMQHFFFTFFYYYLHIHFLDAIVSGHWWKINDFSNHALPNWHETPRGISREDEAAIWRPICGHDGRLCTAGTCYWQANVGRKHTFWMFLTVPNSSTVLFNLIAENTNKGIWCPRFPPLSVVWQSKSRLWRVKQKSPLNNVLFFPLLVHWVWRGDASARRFSKKI